MAIRFKRYLEPLSLASENERPLIIESDAYRQVCTDLELYVNGQILGRSFLVAGHRGAGKTTMLRQAVQEVQSRILARGEAAALAKRPLFIALHGPDLLAPRQTATEEDKADAAARKEEGAKASDAASTKAPPSPVVPPEPPPPNELFHFLDRITSGLYVGAAQEFARCFRRRAERVAKTSRERSELMELAADLQVQLDRQPDLDRLRDYWSRVSALESGVLFDTNTRSGQGVNEVTALFSIGRTMRTFAGTREASEESADNRRREGSVSLMTIDGQNLLSPLLGLATGTLVWSSLGTTTDPLLRALSALLTGFGAVLALKISATRSRATTQTWKEKYIPKDDPGSLYRVLPGLIERFQRVGLAPVFVVDELDKVPRLGSKINSLLGYMKQFVTERSFFCFVTNRSFYQYANAQDAQSAYSTVHTRFGDSVFVRYRPQDFHDYLNRGIDLETEGLQQAQIDQERDAASMLRYILLSRTYLHPFDLRRETAQSQDRSGRVTRSAEDLINSPKLHHDVAMQVAVEVVYNGLDLAEYVRDPIYAQTTLDALYYPLRKWRDGAEALDLEEGELVRYLISRIGIHEEMAEREQELPADKLIPPALQKTLMAQVDRMMQLLCSPSILVGEAITAGVTLPDAVQRMLMALDPFVEQA